MLVRLDAARARLASHHSAPFGGMLRSGHGGKGAGGIGDAKAARQLLLSIFDKAVGGSERQAPRGSGGTRRNGPQGAGARARDGEWGCSCGFPTNRPYRTSCHACGRLRASAEVGRAEGGKSGGRGDAPGRGYQVNSGARGVSGDGRWGGGPVGANGSRPLLGQRTSTHRSLPAYGGAKGSGDGPPGSGKGLAGEAWPGLGRAQAKGGDGTTKGSGKGVGACGESEGKGDVACAQGQDARRWVRPGKIVDDEDFELVQPRRVRAGKGNDGTSDERRRQVVASDDAAGRRPRWSDVESDDEGLGDDDAADDVGDGGTVQQDGDEVDPRRMRLAFEEHARAVRDLERRGCYGPALETLRHARDEAERAWRGAKEPAPLTKRMAWAEAKLHKAEAALTRARQALDAFDQDVEKQREQLCSRIKEADDWYRWRQRQLDEVHAEAGEKAAGWKGRQANGAGAEARRRIRSHMLPEVQAILEELPDGTPIHERLTLLAAGLVDVEQALVDGGQEAEAQRFDLGDDDMCDGEWDADDDCCDDDDGRDTTRRAAAAGDETKSGKPAEWKAEGPGRWTRRAAGQEWQAGGQATGHAGSTASASSDVTRDGATGTGDAKAANQGTEASTRTDGVRGASAGTASGSQAGSDGQSEERSAKHRRTATEEESREESDARRARELHQQQSVVAAAQAESYAAGTGGFGSDAALSLAAQRYVQEVQDAQRRARAKGIDPRADGKDLIQLTPMELQAWVEAHLGGEER